MMSAAAAAYWAIHSGTGRSARPPSPWATTVPMSANLQLEQLALGRFQLDLIDAGQVGGELDSGRLARAHRAREVIAMHMDLIALVALDLDPDPLAALDADPPFRRFDLAASHPGLDQRAGEPGRGRRDPSDRGRPRGRGRAARGGPAGAGRLATAVIPAAAGNQPAGEQQTSNYTAWHAIDASLSAGHPLAAGLAAVERGWVGNDHGQSRFSAAPASRWPGRAGGAGQMRVIPLARTPSGTYAVG